MPTYAIQEGNINWNGGQRITLRSGETAQCSTLVQGQLYGIFLYNSAQNDQDTTVNVDWSNSSPPKPVKVPGTTANLGLASLCFVSGTDTQTIKISVSSGSGTASVDAWLGSVGMPTDTSGLDNGPLPSDGVAHPFDKYRRYYAVPSSTWHQLTITSPNVQFISAQFQTAKAVVNVVRETANGVGDQVSHVGDTAKDQYEVNSSGNNSIQTNLIGGGMQFVWVNADSQQDSDDSTISLQEI